MPRGGKGKPTPGRSYGNRSDYNSGDQYGDVAARQARVDAVPITPPAPPAMAQAPQAPLVAPGAMDRPTERPLEPVTSGLPTGPGPGPSALQPSFDPVVETLRVAYAAFPNESIGALLEAMGGGR